MNEIKLKPCPFCGGKASIIQTQCLNNGYKGYYVFHSCSRLGTRLQTCSYDRSEHAADSWNRRAKDGGEDETD